jgi:hypothetical protein
MRLMPCDFQGMVEIVHPIFVSPDFQHERGCPLDRRGPARLGLDSLAPAGPGGSAGNEVVAWSLRQRRLSR